MLDPPTPDEPALPLEGTKPHVVIEVDCYSRSHPYPLTRHEKSSWGTESLSFVSANGSLLEFDASYFPEPPTRPTLENISWEETERLLHDTGHGWMANGSLLERARKVALRSGVLEAECGRIASALAELGDRDDHPACFDGSDVTYALNAANHHDQVTVYCGGTTAASSELAAAWCRITGGRWREDGACFIA